MQHQPNELAPIETSAFYDALKSIDVDDELGSPLPARAGGLPICAPPPKVAPGAC